MEERKTDRQTDRKKEKKCKEQKTQNEKLSC